MRCRYPRRYFKRFELIEELEAVDEIHEFYNVTTEVNNVSINDKDINPIQKMKPEEYNDLIGDGTGRFTKV
jgi:hypothetical protein